MESVRQRILSSGALQIAFAQPGDAGQYTCMAANVAGSSSTSAKLTVHGRLFSISYFSLLLHHGREKRPPAKNMMEIKTMKNSKLEWSVLCACGVQVHLSFKYVIGRHKHVICANTCVRVILLIKPGQLICCQYFHMVTIGIYKLTYEEFICFVALLLYFSSCKSSWSKTNQHMTYLITVM